MRGPLLANCMLPLPTSAWVESAQGRWPEEVFDSRPVGPTSRLVMLDLLLLKMSFRGAAFQCTEWLDAWIWDDEDLHTTLATLAT